MNSPSFKDTLSVFTTLKLVFSGITSSATTVANPGEEALMEYFFCFLNKWADM